MGGGEVEEHILGPHGLFPEARILKSCERSVGSGHSDLGQGWGSSVMMGESVLDKQGRAWMWSCVLCARLSRESTDVELCVKAESFVSSVFTCFICNRALPRGKCTLIL